MGDGSRGSNRHSSPLEEEAQSHAYTGWGSRAKGSSKHEGQNDEGPQEQSPPPLPMRPRQEHTYNAALNLFAASDSKRPPLQTTATTAVSLTDIHTQSNQEPRHLVQAPEGNRSRAASISGHPNSGRGGLDRMLGNYKGDAGDTASILSGYAPTLEATGDVASLLGDVVDSTEDSLAWNHLTSQADSVEPFDIVCNEDKDLSVRFEHEFQDLGVLDEGGVNEEELLNDWTSRLKHFLVFSAAGMPIYTRHGDISLVANYVGVVQTIIAFYQSSKNSLKAFTAGKSRFVVLEEGPIFLVAISRLGESDNQLRVQLDALYMQILSTLTLPNLKRIFSGRPSTDLAQYLQGTEPLLSALADGFTRGSPSNLISALECLKLRKSQRAAINNAFLKARCPELLYGLIVAGDRLVSVIRPKKHSLHPGDLQLIFNMLFEARSVKTAGGENWIPLCLPGFNNEGHLHMYVSFVNDEDQTVSDSTEAEREKNRESSDSGSPVTIILLSANRESFFNLQKTREDLVTALQRNNQLETIQKAVKAGRPSPRDIAPGSVIRHFLYKSKANVQFIMPGFLPHFGTALARRKLLSIYHGLHSSIHARSSHLKVQHVVGGAHVALAWTTPIFEFYCVAGPNASRNAIAQAANRLVQNIAREEERFFILGGAVF